jgi:hypothetical protein
VGDETADTPPGTLGLALGLWFDCSKIFFVPATGFLATVRTNPLL